MRSSAAARLTLVALIAAPAAVFAPPALASPRRTKTPPPKTPTPAPTAAPTSGSTPKPGALVPEQPYVGTPSATGAGSYTAILRAKEARATAEELLAP